MCVCVGGGDIAWNLEGGEEFQTWNRGRFGIVKPRIVGVGGIGHDFMLHV